MMKRWERALLLAMLLAFCVGWYQAFASDCAQLREDVIRVHILANSDSEADQQLKLAVRDRLIAASDTLFATSAQDKDTAMAQLQQKLPEIERLAEQVVAEYGFDYPVTAQLTYMYFETRAYEQFTLPAGYYDAIRLTIGQGAGHNWWCVMFPPLCLPAASKDSVALQQMVPQQDYELMTQPQYKPAFALLEWFDSLFG